VYCLKYIDSYFWALCAKFFPVVLVHSFDQIGRVVDVKTVFHFYPETRGTTLLRLYFLQLFQDLSSAPVI